MQFYEFLVITADKDKLIDYSIQYHIIRNEIKCPKYFIIFIMKNKKINIQISAEGRTKSFLLYLQSEKILT